jgi:hypothetical protein
MLIRLLLILAALIATPAIAQPWQRFTPPAPRSSVDASAVIAPSAAEPSLATAQANTAQLQALINANDEIRFTQAGDYYFSGRITLDSNTTLHVGPGVTLWRHSGAPGVQLFQTIGTSLTTDLLITGGGSIGRRADGTPTNDDGHTIVLWNLDRYAITNINGRDTAGPNFVNRDGKYWLYCNGTSNGYLANLGAIGSVTEFGIGALSSDFLHFSGRNDRIRIDNVWGAADDNPVAIMNRDYGAYETYNNGVTTVNLFNGSCRFFHITRVHFQNGAEIIRLTGRFMPTARDTDLNTGGDAAGADVTGVAWTAATRVVSKSNLFTDYTWQDGDFLIVTAGTGVKQAGPGGEPSATDVTAAQPLALPIIRKIDANSVEVGVIVDDADVASMTVLNGAYTSEEVSDILIDGVTGSVKPNNSAMGIGLDDDADAIVKLTQAVHRRITIRNASVIVPSAGYALIQSRAMGLRELTLDGVMELAPGSDGSALLYNNTSARTVMSLFDASRATWRARPSGSTSHSLFTFEPSARVLRVGSFDVVSAQTGGACTLINIVGDDGIVSRIDDFSAGDLHFSAIASGSLLRGIVLYNGDGAQVRRGIINSIHMSEGASAINGALNTGATANLRSRIHVNDLRVLGAIGESVVRTLADVTYDRLVRDTASGNLVAAFSADTNAAPTIGPANTLTFTLFESDFTAAATSEIITLASLTRSTVTPYSTYRLPKGASVVNVRVEVLQAFDDGAGAMSASQIDVGVTATPDQYVSNFTTFATGGTLATPSAANAFTAEATWPAFAVRLETTSANVVAATTGAVRVTVTFE